MSHQKPTEAVAAIGRLNITGNVIPATWWSAITFGSGKPDCTAIVLLSDIIYWYRPTEVRDEQTGAVTGYIKRFHGDKLQRSYQSFSDQFGFSKREVTDALKRLRDAGLITLELRSVTVQGGMTLNNVLFIEPVADSVEAITTGTPVTSKRKTLLRSNVTPHAFKRETNTEITTEITTEIKDPPLSPKGEKHHCENSHCEKPLRGTRLPNDWVLPKSWGQWAMENTGLPREQILLEAQTFADYWQSLPGSKAVKLDWEKTWRNWARRSLLATKTRPQQASRRPEPPMPRAFGEERPASKPVRQPEPRKPKMFGEE